MAMDNISIARKLLKMAKQVLSLKAYSHSPYVHVRNSKGKLVAIKIEEVKFILDYTHLGTTPGKAASEKMIVADEPAYKLNEVKNILNCKKRETLRRDLNRSNPDIKNDWTKYNLSIEGAKKVIQSLTTADFVKAHRNLPIPADEYRKKNFRIPDKPQTDDPFNAPSSKSPITLYIKFYVQKRSLVICISFHEEGQ